MVKIATVALLALGEVALLGLPLTVSAQDSLEDRLSEFEQHGASLDPLRISVFYRILGEGSGRSVANVRGQLQRLLTQNPSQRSRIATVMIQQLDRERDAFHQVSSSRELDYIGDLVAVVTTFGDPRAAAPLVGFAHTGNMATDGLADLGPAALPLLLAGSQSGDEMERQGGLLAMGKMAARYDEVGITRQDMSRIRQVLLDSTEDDSWLVRRAAVTGLEAFPDDEVRAVMESLALRDPYVSTAGRRTVRVAARSWLDKHGVGQKSLPEPETWKRIMYGS